MAPVHEAAARGFARSAGAYDRARPEYPAAATAWLAERLGLGPGRTVLDLAAGTGKLTRPLAATGATVVAVEPVAEMRARIGSGARVLDGTAEAIPLEDASVEAVTVGQAFHWFDGPRALGEIHRVLRPGGALALVWNSRPPEDPLHAAIEALVAPLRDRQRAPTHGTNAWRAAFRATSLFGPLEERRFAHRVVHDADALVDRVRSTSVVGALDAKARDGLLAAVRALASGPVELPYVCEVFACDRRP